MKTRTQNLIVALALLALATLDPQLFGGTVITNNLPANTAIINISGTQDGAAAYNGDQSLWYQPFNTGGAALLLKYTVQPGTYHFRVVDPADAARLYPALGPAQTNQIYTGWTFNSPWLEDYLVFSSAAATNTTLPQLFDGAFSNTNGGSGTWTFYGNATDAYIAAISQGYYDLLRTSATGGRDSTKDITAYTFTNAETLIFAVPDDDLGDNSGGVSVVISPAIAPVLNISHSGNTVTVYWQNVSGWTLQQNENLANFTDWSTSDGVATSNSTNYLNITSPTGNLFFRLSHP